MLAAATVRTRWPRFVGSFVALSLGVALTTMVALVLAAAQPRAPRAYDAAPVIVHSGTALEPPWPPQATADLVRRLGEIPFVAAAVPDRSFYAQVVLDGRPAGDPAADPQGHGYSAAALAGYPLVSGRGPDRAGEVALDVDLGPAPGDRVILLTATGPAEHTVTGLIGGPGIYVDDATAAQLASGVRVIGLVTTPGADLGPVRAQAQSIVGASGQVLVGSARTVLESERDRRIRADAGTFLAILVGLSVFVSIFVVASTFALGASQRRPEFGLLRAIGATPGQVRRMLLTEALLVGAVASAAGAILAVILTPPFLGLLVRVRLIPPDPPTELPLWPVPAGAGVGLVVAVLAVRSASRRAAKIAPLEALRDAAVERRPMTPSRWVAGLAALAGGVVLVWATATANADGAVTAAMFSAMALTVGLTLLAPVIITPLVWLVTRPLVALNGATAVLVREGARVAVRRVASTAAPVIATVGFSVLMAGTYATVHAFDLREESQALPAEVIVVPAGTPGLSDAAVAAVPSGVPGSLVTTVFATDAKGRHRALLTDGIDPGLPGREITVRAGSLANLGDDTVAVAEADAANLGWQVGTEAPVAFPDGQRVSLRVVAVLADESVPGELMAARDTVRRHDPSALVSEIYVDGQAPEQLNARLAGLGARAVRADAYVNTRSAEEWRTVRLVFAVIIAMAVGYTAIAIANTLMMATADRSREFALLRLAGAGIGQVLRVVAAEAALVVGIGTLLGMTAAVTALAGVVSGLRDYIPDTPIVLPWPVVGAVVSVCLLLALVASVVPARLLLRTSTAALAREPE
jgi:putative ABC transport system permease protein